GYYEFSYIFECNENNVVEEYHYLGSDNCNNDNERYLVATYNASDSVCSNKKDCSGGELTFYRNGCDLERNWKSSKYESNLLYGVCLPLYEENLDEPWYSNIYYQRSTFNKNFNNMYYYFS